MRKIRIVLAFMAIAVALMACSKKGTPDEGEPVKPPVTTTDKVYDL
jgi:ABC-type oligopeptide transport system substrate-binding subunit